MRLYAYVAMKSCRVAIKRALRKMTIVEGALWQSRDWFWTERQFGKGAWENVYCRANFQLRGITLDKADEVIKAVQDCGLSNVMSGDPLIPPTYTSYPLLFLATTMPGEGVSDNSSGLD